MQQFFNQFFKTKLLYLMIRPNEVYCEYCNIQIPQAQ